VKPIFTSCEPHQERKLQDLMENIFFSKTKSNYIKSS